MITTWLRIGIAIFTVAVSGCSMDQSGQRKDGFVTTSDGVKLYYAEQGHGPEVLIAPVGFYLEPHLLNALSGYGRVIFYDPRNRGRSGAGDLDKVSLDQSTADLETLREALGVEKMALLGWSGLAMEMAVYTLQHPDRVSKLIQISPVPPAAYMMSEAEDTTSHRIDQSAIAELDQRSEAGEFTNSPEEYCRLRSALADPEYFVDPAYISQMPDLCVYENEWPINLWRYFGKLLPSFGDYDWREDMKQLHIPRLIIHGREDGIPLTGAEAWTAGYPEARLLVLSPSAHFPYIEQKAIVIDAILTFLDGEWPQDAVSMPAD